MIDGLEIIPQYFGDDVSYVLVKIDVGLMAPRSAKKYIEHARREMTLFGYLDSRGIDYDIVGVRRDNHGLTVETTSKPQPQEYKETLKPSIDASKEDGTDDLVNVRTNFLKIMAETTNKSEDKVFADRNEILKANDIGDDLKKDSFADAMKLAEK